VVSETVTVTFGDGIPFTNSVTGETGTITGADISAERIIWYYRADGISYLNSITYGDQRDTISRDEWYVKNKELMGWLTGFSRAIWDATLIFTDGTNISSLWLGCGPILEDDTGMEVNDFRDPIDMDALESITVAGETYPIG